MGQAAVPLGLAGRCLVQAGFTLPDKLPIVLASRGGFSKQVQAAGETDSRIRLVAATGLLHQVR